MSTENPNLTLTNTQGATLYLTPDYQGVWVEVMNADGEVISSYCLSPEQAQQVIGYLDKQK